MALPKASAATGSSVSSACICGAGMPGTSARLQPLHHCTGDIRSTCGARCALCAATAVVMVTAEAP
jgi:hypothetical protein